MLLFSTLVFSQVPDPYYPKAGQVFQATSLTFSWNGVTDATTYTLQYANNAAFNAPVTVNGITATSHFVNTLAMGNRYWWRVRAVTPQGTTAWSATHTFSVYLPNNFPGISFWISADGSLVKDANNLVSEWTDMSGNSNSVSQPNSNEQPTWIPNGINGLPAVRFDGTNDYMNGGNINNIGTTSKSIFIVARSNTGSGCYLAKSLSNSTANRYGFLYLTNSIYAPLWHDVIEINNIYSKPSGRTEFISFAAKRDTAAPYYNSRVYNIDSSGFSVTRFNIQGTSHNMSSTRRFLLGAYNNGNDNGQSFPLNGFISEVIMYDAAFPDSTRRLVEKMIMDKYAPPVNLGADMVFANSFCDTIIRAGRNFVFYAWSTGASGIADSNLTVSAAGKYKVTATDIFGRKTIDSILIVRPDPNYLGVPTYCLNGEVKWNTGLNNTDYNFLWSQGGTDSFITISSPGTYRVTVTDLRGCSFISAPVVFSPDSFALKINLTTGTDTSLCTGNTLGLSAGNSMVQSYNWSTGATSSFIAVDTPGLYKVTVTNSRGCIGVDSVEVLILGDGPIPNFVADSVCFGLPTSFTDASVIPPPNTVSAWRWNFGNGDTSILQNPQYTYSDTGTYLVTLLAISNLGCSSSPITKPVVVYPRALANFNDSLGCINTPVAFNSLSIAPPGSTIVGYLWDFGNSSTSTLQNPTYTYPSAGNYTVTLTITTSFGCESSITKPFEVVSSAPLPGNTVSLLPENNVNVISPAIQFVWRRSVNAYEYRLEVSTTSNFSNIVFSATTADTSVSASTIPPSLNAYYWRVRALNVCNQGSTSATRIFYRIKPDDFPNLAFWVSADGPLVKNSSNFVTDWFDRSTQGNNVFQLTPVKQPRWIDSIPTINYKPAIRFSGTQVLEGGDKLDMGNASRTFIVVGQTNANSVTGTYFGKSLAAPGNNRYGLLRLNEQLTFFYHDQNDFTLVYPATYGNFEVLTARVDRTLRQISLQQNNGPTLTNINIQGPSYNMNSTFRFLVGAYNSSNDFSEVFGLNGHIAEIIIFDTVLNSAQLNAIKIYLDKKYTKPVDLGPDINIAYGYCNQITLDASERYISYLWSTGDTTKQLPITVAGTYSVTVVDAFGNQSSDTVNVNMPSLLPPPRLTFCDQDSIVWNVDQGSAYSYTWSTGDTTPALVIKQGGPVTITIADTVPNQLGGPCSISATYVFEADSFSILTTLGPDTSVCGGALIGLASNAQNVLAYNWSTGSTDTAIVVITSGVYTVNVLNNTGCQASDTIVVNIAGLLPNVNFTVPNAFCLGDSSYFTNQSTIQAPYNILEYKWQFGANGDTSNAINPSYYYSAPGTYNVSLEVTADSGCVANRTKTVQIFNKPTAKFSYKIGCAGIPLAFSDQSTGVTNDAINQWMWHFGDDSTSTLRNPSHVYQQPGIYEVSLMVTSTTGCTSVFTDTLEVYPELVVDMMVDNLCFGETTQFTDASPGFSNISWLWEFGANNDVSPLKNPTYNYTQTGTFVVKLTAKNALGCEATDTDTISIVQPPTANFTYNVACQDFNFRLNDASTPANINDPIVKWHWEFNDGGLPSNAPNPVRTYDTIGTFPVTLSIESANGCPASVTKQVVIAPAPTASFTFTPDYGAAPLPVTYINTSTGALSYQWYFGDGGYSEDENPVHTFTYNTDFITTLVAIGPGGCRDTVSNTLTVNIATLDIAVVDIDVEKQNNRVRPYATIINQGTRNVSHYYLTATLGDGSRITERVDTPLLSGTGMVYYFVAGYEATELQVNSFLCIQASQPNDETDDNAQNDRLCKPLENDIRIVPPYPNPAKDVATFEVLIPRAAPMEISLYDVLGHKLQDIFNGPAEVGTTTFKLNLNGYARGMYIIRVKYNEDEYMLKFVAD